MAAEDYHDFMGDRYLDGPDYDGEDDGYDYRPPRREIPPVWVKGRHTGVRTLKALLWEMPDGERQWFPRTHVIELQQNQMLISGWIAEQKGIKPTPVRPSVAARPDEPPPVQSPDEYGFKGYIYDQGP